ncbi:4-hydroxy-tetrahydrodipicolinate reductase [Leifsonia sp. Root112D2]|uniref:4-hydroxy-tetrahydrodipicolinate reductase n=1 Tax=Leifsonia sp. Root112D2 TaxID=1736426 RepID=UPI0006F25AC3|nr:4-hydroxy-tetrahydrodipicolinate reductase [Leifsonia sp. Root112D2]KQV05115.1 4-hydroxy-tetrahydrodipicolinate reductase [Leifsonia sp. Root112D2]
MTIRVAVTGATGKLGSVAVRLIEAAEEFELVAALDSKAPLTEMLGANVLLDVTLPSVSATIVEYALGEGLNVVVGTSGWTAERIAALGSSLAEGQGVIVIPNFSLGSALATSFAAAASRFYDSVEIVEAHRATKIDSPSGTAVRTAELIGEARATRGPVVAPHSDQRARGQQVASVPIHSMRMQGIVARQEVVLGGAGETLSIAHNTVDSSAYEAGILLALRAAAGATGVTVGLESLIDLSGSE